MYKPDLPSKLLDIGGKFKGGKNHKTADQNFDNVLPITKTNRETCIPFPQEIFLQDITQKTHLHIPELSGPENDTALFIKTMAGQTNNQIASEPNSPNLSTSFIRNGIGLKALRLKTLD